MTTTSPTPADLLETAAALIGTHGLAKQTLGNEEVGFCALGSCDAAANILYTDPDVWHVAVNAFEKTLDYNRVNGIGSWNDVKSRTKRQVIDRLLAVAARLRGSADANA